MLDQLSTSLHFKPISISCFPRFEHGMISNDIPLAKYCIRIYASNCNKFIQPLDNSNINQFQPQDGLMYYLTKAGNIKLLICVCMYNQSKYALENTLKGIYSNLNHLQQQGICSEQLAVVIIQDGILKLVSDFVTRQYVNNNDSLIYFYRQIDQRQGKSKCQLQQRINIILDEIDNYHRNGLIHLLINNKYFPPSINKKLSLLYQNMWKPLQIQLQQQYHLKIISCFKHQNGTKLSSHLWFFQGFCRQFHPQLCILLDVGTKPSPKSISKFISAFEDSNIGGVTGFMTVDSTFNSYQGDHQQLQIQQSTKTKNTWFEYLLTLIISIEGAQQFEYIISHLIDKNYESCLGFLQVLPGAWSGYRYQALITGSEYEQNLLQRKYFKKILKNNDNNCQCSDYAQDNMYLAEDRILSLGIFCQENHNYKLKYIPDAIAFTDPMKTHQQLMVQRRRWINSSFFAFKYVYRNYNYHVKQSNHHWIHQFIILKLSMLLALLSFVNGYLAPAFYFFILYTTIIQSGSNILINYAAEVISLIYLLMILICILWSLNGVEWTYQAHYISYIFTLYTLLLIGLVIWNICGVYLQLQLIQSLNELLTQFDTVVVLLMTTVNILVYLIIVMVHIPTHGYFIFRLFRNCLNYLTYQGAYSHVMLIYAFCNVDDVSWGTKGNNNNNNTNININNKNNNNNNNHANKKILRNKYLIQKVSFITRWFSINAVVAFLLLYIDIFIPRQSNKGIALLIMGMYATFILFIKTILALFNHLYWIISTQIKCCNKITNIDENKFHTLKKYWYNSYIQYLNILKK